MDFATLTCYSTNADTKCTAGDPQILPRGIAKFNFVIFNTFSMLVPP